MTHRAGLVLGVSVALLVVLAVVAAVVATTRPEPQLPAGSPEAAVQDYIRAVHRGDVDEAATHLDPAGRCAVEDLEGSSDRSTARVVLRDSDVDGDEARVRVDFVHGGGGLFGAGDEYRDEQRYELRRDGDRWVITGEPWPMFGCLGQDPRP